jgi:hypothetical protein
MNILGYKHFTEDDDALRIFALYDNVRGKRPQKEYLNIGYFELTKKNVETVNQEHWKTYFLTGEAANDAPEYIKKASSVIEYSNLSKEERDMLDARERAENIYIAERHAAYCEGEIHGEKRGVELTLNVTADLKNGLSVDEIAEKNNTDIKIVEQIQDSIG